MQRKIDSYLKNPISKVLLLASFCSIYSNIWTAANMQVTNALKLANAVHGNTGSNISPAMMVPKITVAKISDLSSAIPGIKQTTLVSTLSNNQISSFDFNFAGMDHGYSFIANPWNSAQSTAANISLAIQKQMIAAFNAGSIILSVVAFDQNGNVISDVTKAKPVFMALYVFDQLGNIIGAPITFATNAYSSVSNPSSLFTNKTVQFGGFNAPVTNLTYPFVLNVMNKSQLATEEEEFDLKKSTFVITDDIEYFYVTLVATANNESSGILNIDTQYTDVTGFNLADIKKHLSINPQGIYLNVWYVPNIRNNTVKGYWQAYDQKGIAIPEISGSNVSTEFSNGATFTIFLAARQTGAKNDTLPIYSAPGGDIFATTQWFKLTSK